ncbi:MAG: universal stress protein [Bacteroidota bacterium]
MKKILVTTDFSANSKAGLKFAIQLSQQEKVQLTFFNSYYILKPTSWESKRVRAYELAEVEKLQLQLEKFVAAVYKSMSLDGSGANCVLSSAVAPDGNIVDYAAKNNFDFICISTRGAGTIRKIFGTNTSTVIKKSKVPVISVPHNYKPENINTILYASDLDSLNTELKTVINFNKSLKAKIELLHFDFPAELHLKEKMMTDAKKKYAKQNISLHLANINIANSFVSNLEGAVKRSKPSLLIMFKHTQKSIFDKIFVPSYSAEFSFISKVPLIVFAK